MRTFKSTTGADLGGGEGGIPGGSPKLQKEGENVARVHGNATRFSS